MLGERVERHLSVAAVVGQSGRAQRSQVVGDEVLGALADPGEVADAELTTFAQCERDRQPGWVAERAEALRELTRLPLGRSRGPDRLRLRQVEAEQLTTIIRHTKQPNGR